MTKTLEQDTDEATARAIADVIRHTSSVKEQYSILGIDRRRYTDLRLKFGFSVSNRGRKKPLLKMAA